MKRAAVGVRVHSGWGALVAVSGAPGAEEVIERSRVEITDPKMPGAIQPYHFVKSMEIQRAQQHVAQCVAASRSLALKAISELLQQLQKRGYQVTASCILLSSGRPLPEVSGILASHALIHTAEGEFFRSRFRDAFEALKIPVTGIRERDLPGRAQKAFGKAATKVQERVAAMGRSLGPPWTTDQKAAALAALIVLA
ncbi:MAG TPA: hypothetical protein VI636_02465 [Candidatus Angelobacter sp.]